MRFCKLAVRPIRETDPSQEAPGHRSGAVAGLGGGAGSPVRADRYLPPQTCVVSSYF